MNSLSLGLVVVSTQGHDKGELYVVVKVGEREVSLCDGKYKLLSKPKRKNISHIQPTDYIEIEIADKLSRGLKINDQMIYHAILKYKKIVKEELYGKR